MLSYSLQEQKLTVVIARPRHRSPTQPTQKCRPKQRPRRLRKHLKLRSEPTSRSPADPRKSRPNCRPKANRSTNRQIRSRRREGDRATSPATTPEHQPRARSRNTLPSRSTRSLRQRSSAIPTIRLLEPLAPVLESRQRVRKCTGRLRYCKKRGRRSLNGSMPVLYTLR